MDESLLGSEWASFGLGILIDTSQGSKHVRAPIPAEHGRISTPSLPSLLFSLALLQMLHKVAHVQSETHPVGS
jgi:hypothetical protein